jgi:hypothetical protein
LDPVTVRVKAAPPAVGDDGFEELEASDGTGFDGGGTALGELPPQPPLQSTNSMKRVKPAIRSSEAEVRRFKGMVSADLVRNKLAPHSAYETR